MCTHFRAIDSSRSLIISLKTTTTFVEYEAVLTEIGERFAAEHTIKANRKVETQSAAQYLRKIHFSSVTKFGNGNVPLKKHRPCEPNFGHEYPLFWRMNYKCC